MNAYLLDTNIVSYYLRRSSAKLEAKMTEGLRGQQCAISVITRAELRYGQTAMAHDDKRRALIDAFLMQVPSLPWTTSAADLYGALKTTLKREGMPIGELDTQIAAHALAEDLILVTHNTRHFEREPGLTIEDWFG